MSTGQIAEFLRRFHRPDDEHPAIFIGASVGRNEHWEERAFDTVEAAAAFAVDRATTHNLYFTHGHIPIGSSRRKEAGVGARAFCVDVDVKDGAYPNAATARAELDRFCVALGLPPTAVVTTGSGGLQGWWVWDDVLPKGAWQNFANRLGAAASAKYHNLKIDRICTTNIVQPMRLPRSSNFKYDAPLPVEVLATGPTYRLMDIAPKLVKYEPDEEPEARAARKATAKFVRKIGADPKVFCGQLSKSLAEGGANDSREVWRTCLQFASVLDEPDRTDTAVRLSHQWTCRRTGKAFDQNDMNTVLNGLRFPPTCTSFNDVRPGICVKCPSWKHIQSPISLMEHKIVHTPERQQAIDAEIGKFRNIYTSHIGSVPTPDTARAALAAVGAALDELKARDEELTRECAHRLMAHLTNWEWNEHVVRRAGVLAGLSESQAARWAFKLFATKEFENTSNFAIKRDGRSMS